MTTRYGYFFHSSTGEYPVGHPQFDFNLFSQPTGEHFDPHRAALHMITDQGRIAPLTLSHPWHGPTQYRACAGRVNLHDHKGKVVVAYTLGGSLTLDDQGTYTHCSLTSPAPIIDLLELGSTSTLLANEIECLLARRRAALSREEDEFDRRLMAADPQILFMACLSTLEEKLGRLSAETHSQPYQDLLLLVRKTIRSLQKQDIWTKQSYALHDIL